MKYSLTLETQKIDLCFSRLRHSNGANILDGQGFDKKNRKLRAKGGLISESFSLWLKFPKMDAKTRPRACPIYLHSAQGRDLAPILGAKVKNFLKLSHL